MYHPYPPTSTIFTNSTRATAKVTFVLLSCAFNVSLRAATTHYVDRTAASGGDGTSWSTAHSELQSALAEAVAGDQIHVARGTYTADYDPAAGTHTGNRAASFQLKTGIIVLGGFPAGGGDPATRRPSLHETILSGDLAGDDGPPTHASRLRFEAARAENAYHVVVTSAGDTLGVLDGVIITGGHANGTNEFARAGGLVMVGTGTHIRNCTFRANFATQYGGAVYVSNSTGTFVNCSFLGNAASGGGATYHSSSHAATMTNCVFSGNWASSSGGAGYFVGSSPTISNCTVVANTAVTCGGLYYSDINPVLANCILWGNRDGNGISQSSQVVKTGYTGTPQVNHCCLQGLTGSLGGTGNISTDPLLTGAFGADEIPGTPDDNLHPGAHSPCMDAGDNARVAKDLRDFDGDGNTTEAIPVDREGYSRFVDNPNVVDSGSGSGPKVDLGAYEYTTPLLISADRVSVAEEGESLVSVALTVDPGGPIEIEVVRFSGDMDLAAGPERLYFDSSNFATPQTLSFTAQPDDDFSNGSAAVRLFGDGIRPISILAREADDEPVPSILYVDAAALTSGRGTAWNEAFVQLQEALEVIANRPGSSEIRIAAGSYRADYHSASGTRSLDRTASFQLQSGVVLRGAYAGGSHGDPDERDPIVYETVLTGDQRGDDGPDFTNCLDNSLNVLVAENTAAGTALEGLTIRGGSCVFPRGDGAGLRARSSVIELRDCVLDVNQAFRGAGVFLADCQARLVNCTFRGNLAKGWNGYAWSGYGGGLYVFGGASISGCSFTNNTGYHCGGGAYVTTGTTRLDGCTFEANIAGLAGAQSTDYFGGGGLYAAQADLKLVRCFFMANTTPQDGAGLHTDQGTATVHNSRFLMNAAQQSGGAICNRGACQLELANCVLSGNKGTSGGGIYSPLSGAAIHSCTLTGNTGSGISAQATTGNKLTVRNSILWSNGASPTLSAQISSSGSPSPSVSYSCISGCTGCYGTQTNFSADPHFRVAGRWDTSIPPAVWREGDYRLVDGSPCVDRGSPALFPADRLDLDGDLVTSEPIPLDFSNLSRVIGSTTDIGAYEFPFCLTADLNQDGIVDGTDVSIFCECATGSAVPYYPENPPPACTLAPLAEKIAADIDADGDIDMNDFAALQRSLGCRAPE